MPIFITVDSFAQLFHKGTRLIAWLWSPLLKMQNPLLLESLYIFRNEESVVEIEWIQIETEKNFFGRKKFDTNYWIFFLLFWIKNVFVTTTISYAPQNIFQNLIELGLGEAKQAAPNGNVEWSPSMKTNERVYWITWVVHNC